MGRVRSDYLVVSFGSTAVAMACEALCERQGLPGRTIPLPSQISAGCGLAWRVRPEEGDAVLDALKREGIIWTSADVVQLWDLVSDRP